MKVSLNGARDNIEQGKTLDEIAKLDKIVKKIGQNQDKHKLDKKDKLDKDWTKWTTLEDRTKRNKKSWTKVERLDKNRQVGKKSIKWTKI